MSKITFTAKTYVASPLPDLTALTAKGGVWDDRHGFTEADWFALREGFELKIKLQGLNQLYPEPFTDGPGAMPVYGGISAKLGVTWTREDCNTPDTDPASFQYWKELLCPGVGAGFRQLGMIANTKLHKATFFLWQDGDATFTASGHLTDGSTPDVTYTIPAGTGPRWYEVLYQARTDCYFQHKIKCTSAGSGNGKIWLPYATIGVPTPASQYSIMTHSRGRR